MDTTIYQSLWSAFESLRVAEQELQRPREDAVTLCACQCTRNSVSEFLRSYLFIKTSKRFHDASLSELKKECSRIDAQFGTLDITCFDCRDTAEDSCDKEYCLSVEKVNTCFEKAYMIRELVMTKLDLPEEDYR